ncbi:MAG: DUF2240 family protein [Archaeoglobus sp.]|nr:DUF2240 family protein [Archaeoglobus sp.]
MLSQIIAAAFKSKGKRKMTKSDLTYVLSFDFKWFSHSLSKKVVEEAIKNGLLTFNEGKLEPTFDLKKVEVPLDFKPDIRRIFKFSIFDELVDLISEKLEKSKPEVVAEINRMQEKFSGLLSAEVIALLYAKGVGLDVKPYFKRLWEEIF